MLKVGDTVKVISKTDCDGIMKEFIPIGTICTVVEVCKEKGKVYYGIVDFNKAKRSTYYGAWYYLENELEKGHVEWVKED